MDSFFSSFLLFCILKCTFVVLWVYDRFCRSKLQTIFYFFFSFLQNSSICVEGDNEIKKQMPIKCEFRTCFSMRVHRFLFSILLFVESSSSKDQIKHIFFLSFFFLSNCYACILYLHLYPHSANENIFIIAMRSVIFSTSTKIKLKYCMANAWVITGEERKKINISRSTDRWFSCIWMQFFTAFICN